MQYMALIYSTGECGSDPAVREAYGKFTREMIAKGFFKHGDALQNSDMASCVSVREGKTGHEKSVNEESTTRDQD